MGKKNKFDLTSLVKTGFVSEGETLFFVSNPDCSCIIEKSTSNDFKVKHGTQIYSVHAICEEWLGSEPPGHASKWIRNADGKTLYDLWQLSLEELAA